MTRETDEKFVVDLEAEIDAAQAAYHAKHGHFCEIRSIHGKVPDKPEAPTKLDEKNSEGKGWDDLSSTTKSKLDKNLEVDVFITSYQSKAGDGWQMVIRSKNPGGGIHEKSIGKGPEAAERTYEQDLVAEPATQPEAPQA